MPTNVSVGYQKAEADYFMAQTAEEKLMALENMWSNVPSHKGAENLRKNIRTRIKKLREKIKKESRKKAGKKGIRKEEMQAVLIGFSNSGKSSLLSRLTNAKTEISSSLFTTKKPVIGTMLYKGARIQIIDMPAINYEDVDFSAINGADLLLLVITNPDELKKLQKFLIKAKGKQLVVLNRTDLLSKEQLRKFSANLSTNKKNFVIVSAKTGGGIKELQKKIFSSFNKIRVYTKNKGKVDSEPIILDKGAKIKDVAEKIRKGFSAKVKEARVTGPSSKFPNQIVSSEHIVAEDDVVEFKFE